MTIIQAAETNYVILTAEQFVNDYPRAITQTVEGPVLVITDDDDKFVLGIEGENLAMLAELVSDISDYASDTADPGAVVAAVGRSSTVLGERAGAALYGDSDPAL